MSKLTTTYMGMELKNPLIVGACSLTSHMDAIRKIEDAGAAALTIRSLFEEQIHFKSQAHEDDIHLYDNWHAEMQSIFPEIEHAGPDEHLMWTERAVEAVDIPVIASLNAINSETWAQWAKKFEDIGVSALELNLFGIPDDRLDAAISVEDSHIAAIKAVRSAVKIPISVKLSPYYTSPIQFMTRLVEAGADALVLLNRFFHPTVDIDLEASQYPWELSSSSDLGLPLRFVSMMAGRTKADICGSNGIHTAVDAIGVLLAGASAFQTVSSLYKNKLTHIKTILKGIEDWMDAKEYGAIVDFQGKLSEKTNPAAMMYQRANYVRMLLRSKDYVEQPKLI